MQDGVLNLCRVKLRDQQRLAHGPLKEYSQFGEGIPFGDAVPRAGNDSGGGQPGPHPQMQGLGDRPQRLHLLHHPGAGVGEDLRRDRRARVEDATRTTPSREARLPRLNEVFGTIEEWTMTKTKFEAMEILNQYDIPCGPILSMKEIAEDRSLYETGTLVEVDHPTRGKYVSVGNPIKLSDSPAEVARSPLLGEHTQEILRDVLGFSESQVEEIEGSGALGGGAHRIAAE